MSNQNQKSISLAKHYAALTDAYDLGENDLSWMETALNHVRKEILKLKEKAENGENISEYHFSELTVFLDMYSYLAEECLNQHAQLAKDYGEKFKAEIKGGIHD